jgi:hypothetical protein
VGLYVCSTWFCIPFGGFSLKFSRGVGLTEAKGLEILIMVFSTGRILACCWKPLLFASGLNLTVESNAENDDGSGHGFRV